MLIRFKVGNYLSFNEIQELSMIAGPTRMHSNHICNVEDVQLLKLAAIYGANASGKSNLIEAMKEAKQFILGTRGIERRNWFRLKKENKSLPSLFEFEIEIDSTIYSYGFEIIISEQRIKSEWLYMLFPINKLIFQRIDNKITHEFDNDHARLDVYIEDMQQLSDKLFLHEMSKKMRPDEEELLIFLRIHNWFKEKMWIFDADEYPSPADSMGGISELMHSLGTGITSAEYKRMDPDLKLVPDHILDSAYDILKSRKNTNALFFKDDRISLSDDDKLIFERLVFTHGNKDVCFTFDEESDGSKRLYNLQRILLEKNSDMTYIIDELDLRLHPKLTYRFIEQFIERTNGNKNQLIFTTHESHILDFNLLRRDEIWFIEKNDDVSTLYSLEEFAERTDKKIDKAYLEGRYGSIPIFSTIPPQKEDPCEN